MRGFASLANCFATSGARFVALCEVAANYFISVASVCQYLATCDQLQRNNLGQISEADLRWGGPRFRCRSPDPQDRDDRSGPAKQDRDISGVLL